MAVTVVMAEEADAMVVDAEVEATGAMALATGAMVVSKGKTEKEAVTITTSFFLSLVPRAVLFSNHFLHDLAVLWELHEWIPDPITPTYSK